MSRTTQSDGFSAAELEAGRRLFAAEWKFLGAAGSFDALPPSTGIEIAFGKADLLGDVGGVGRLGIHTLGEQVVMQ